MPKLFVLISDYQLFSSLMIFCRKCNLAQLNFSLDLSVKFVSITEWPLATSYAFCVIAKKINRTQNIILTLNISKWKTWRDQNVFTSIHEIVFGRGEVFAGTLNRFKVSFLQSPWPKVHHRHCNLIGWNWSERVVSIQFKSWIQLVKILFSGFFKNYLFEGSLKCVFLNSE